MTLSSGESSHPKYNHFIHLADFFVHEVPSGQHACWAHKATGGSLRFVPLGPPRSTCFIACYETFIVASRAHCRILERKSPEPPLNFP